jgi:cysteine-rich repeat protein
MRHPLRPLPVALLILALAAGPAHALCGDHALDPGESCDDGNLVPGDGCGADCRVETPARHWLKDAFGFYVGDFNPAYGDHQMVVGPQSILALVYGGERYPLVFDRENGTQLFFITQNDAGPIEAFGGDFLMREGYPQRVHRYDGTTLERRATFEDPTPGPSAFDFGFVFAGIGDKVLIRDDTDLVVYVFDAATGTLLRTLSEPPPGDPAAFGRGIVALGADALVFGAGAVHRFDLETGTLVRTFVAPPGPHVRFPGAIATLGADVLVAGRVAGNGVVYLFDGAGGDVRHVFRAPAGAIDREFGTSILVTGDDVVIEGGSGIYVFDAASRRLRHVIASPRRTDTCFGSPLPAFDGHLVASDRCALLDDDHQGLVYLFDHDDGRLLADIPDPGNEYDDRFEAKATYATTILTRFENVDDAHAVAYRPCTDGVLEPGEECDDGNRTSGDGCDLNCTVSRCGNGILAGDEECDDGNHTPDDGCEPDCRRTAIVCAGGHALEGARLTLRNLGGAPGDESLVLAGALADAAALPVDLDPALAGAQVVVEDAAGATLFELSARTSPVPPGARGSACGPADGWRATGGLTVYDNRSAALDARCTPGSARGLRRLALRRSAGPDRLRVQMKVAAGSIPTPQGAVTVRVILGGAADGRAGRCGEHTFGACRASASGATVVCR